MIFPTGRQVALRITLVEPMMIDLDRDDAAQSRGGASSARCRR
jgi:hypothetical protein